MALRFETIQGTRVALGVEWYEVPPGSAADEKTISARLTKSARANHKLRLERNGKTRLGLASTRGQGNVPGRVMSALAWYALSHVDNHDPQAIVWVLGDPNKSSDASTARAWVAAIVDGVPVARGDRIARIGDVSTVLHEMLGLHAQSAHVHVVGLNETNFGLFGEHYNEFASLEQQSIKTLFAETCHPASEMVRLGLSRLATSAIVVMLTIAIVGGSVGSYYWYLKERVRKGEVAREAERKRLAALPKPNALYAANFANVFNGGEQKIAAADGAKGAYDMLKDLPYFERGWTFTSFTCSTKRLAILPGSVPAAANAPVAPTCEVEYKRSTEAGPSPIPASQYPVILAQVDKEIGRRPSAFRRMLLEQNVQPDKLIDMFRHPASIDDVLRKSRIAKDMSLSVSFDVPVKIPPSAGQPALDVSSSTYTIKRGTWSMSGPYALYELLYDLPPTAMIETVKVIADTEGNSFRAEGFYYASEDVPAAGTLAAPDTATNPAANMKHP